MSVGSPQNTRAGLGLIVAAALCAGCIAPAVPLRPLAPHGALLQGDRHIDYDPGVTWFTLANGLIVGLIPDDRANLVSVDVRYQVGAAEDPSGKSGLAHLVEHLTFDQRAEPGGPTINDRLQRVALYHNASTTWDATHYNSIALAPDVDELLAIESSRLADGCYGIDAAEFAREHAVVAQELHQRGTSGLADQVRGLLLGSHHAYARPPGGVDLATLTLADARSFVDTYYGPDRAILLVGGRIDVRTLRATITQRFGGVERRAMGARTKVAPLVPAKQISELRVPGPADRALVVVTFPAAPWGSAAAADDELLDALMLQKLHAPWIVRADAGGIGGALAGVRYIAIVVSDPARVDDAASAVFDSAAVVARSSPAVSLTGLRARWHTQMIDRFESFASRALLCADALQFAGDKQCRLREFRALERDPAPRVLARARLRVPGASHVIRILPSEGEGRDVPTASDRGLRAALEAGADDGANTGPAIDVPVWRAAVDPAEAEGPIALPLDPPATEVSEFRLPNGLRVLMAGNFKQPVVEARLVFPVGKTGTRTRDDLVAYAAANLLMHDLGRSYTPADTNTVRWLLGLGAELSAEVTDHTAFQIRGSSVFADWHLWRLAWLVRDGIYARSELARIRTIAARDKQRVTRERDRTQAVRRALFGPGHPYVREPDLAIVAETVSIDELERFREAYYRAGNGTLIITGAFEPAAMQRTVTAVFGSWPAGPVQPWVARTPPMRPVAGPTWFAHDDPQATQVRVTLGFAARSSRITSRAARAVASEMIRARLALVRSQLGASYGLDARYMLTSAGDFFQIDGVVAAARAGEVLQRVLANLAQLRTPDGAFAADFVVARRAALAYALADPALTDATAHRLELAVTRRASVTDGNVFAASVAAISPRDVEHVIVEDIAPMRMVGVLSGRPAETAQAASTAGLQGIRAISGASEPRL